MTVQLKKTVVGIVAVIVPMFYATTSIHGSTLDDLMTASNAAHATVTVALVEEEGADLASVFTDKAVIITPRGRSIRGRFTIRTSASILLPGIGGGRLNISRQTLNLIDSTGYETGSYTFTRVGKDDKEETYSGRYTAIWQVEDGRWKIDRLLGIR